MAGNPFAGMSRIGWTEFWGHLKSPRLIILAILFALLVFGVSYGMSQSANPFANQGVIFGHPAIVNVTGVSHYRVIAWVADYLGTPRSGVTLSVSRTDYGNLTPYQQPPTRLLGNMTTNATGFARMEVGTVLPANASFVIQGPSSVGGMGGTMFYPGMENQTFTANTGGYGYGGPYGSASVEYMHVMTMTGLPASAADIALNGTVIGHPDSNGFYSLQTPVGESILTVSYQGYSEDFPIYGSPSSGPAYQNGADVILLQVTAFFGLILPIAAIAVSFDAVARERAQGSLEILLAKRVRREGILMGKFLGAFAAVAVPVVVVLLAGVGVLTLVSGKTPTGTFVTAVLVSSLFLVAVYILLMLLFSTLAKSVGTAVVFGVVLWLFFNLFFSFITFFAVVGSGGYFNADTYATLVTLQLFDPNTIFTMLVTLAIPAVNGNPGLVPTGYVSFAAVVAAAVLWVAALLAVTLFVFRKKAES